MFLAYLMTIGLFLGCIYITQVIMKNLKESDKEHLKQIGM